MKALMVSQILEKIRVKADDGDITSLIESCHVGFDLDITTLDRLSGAGASFEVLDALNNDALAHATTLEQARVEVAALQQYVNEIYSGAGDGRGSELNEMLAEYKAQRTTAARIGPKGEFETTAEYTERARNSQTALAALDQAHQAKMDVYSYPFKERIRLLKERPYPVAGRVVYKSYDADSKRLAAVFDGEEYWFSDAPPEIARDFKEHWNNVRIGENYDETGSRILFMSYLGPLLEGRPRAEIEPAEQRQAALAQIQKQTQTAAGEWVDPWGGMWTLKDSGTRLRWDGAEKYCRSLRTGGFSNWGLPSVGALERIVDRRSNTGIKGGIVLTGQYVWTSDPVDLQMGLTSDFVWVNVPERFDPNSYYRQTIPGGGWYKWQFAFPGGRWPFPAASSNATALCVR